MYFKIIVHFPVVRINGLVTKPERHDSVFLQGDTEQDALRDFHSPGRVVSVRPMGPARIPDLSEKRAYGYSREEWQEIRWKRTRGRRPNPRGPRRAK